MGKKTVKIVFFIKSETINLDKYTIKNPTGSTGRIDVIVRCVLAALSRNFKLEENIELWAFLNNYGTYIFKAELFQEEDFPFSELKFMDCWVKLIKAKDKQINTKNPLNKIIVSDINILDAIEQLTIKGFHAFVLHENGKKISPDLFKKGDKYLFITGNQTGEFLDSELLLKTKIPRIKLGSKSLLASSVIKLIKFKLIE
jgi:tRNA pseudouridine-54 N-methylase